jgi:hypothetical protein
LDDLFCIGQGFVVRLAVRHATWQFRDLRNESTVLVTPKDDDLVSYRDSILPMIVSYHVPRVVPSSMSPAYTAS